jgi:hypothetical protein
VLLSLPLVPHLSRRCRNRSPHRSHYGKIRFRKRDITGIEARILAKETLLKTLWGSRLGHQMEALPEYDEVFRTLRRELRQAGFPE